MLDARTITTMIEVHGQRVRLDHTANVAVSVIEGECGRFWITTTPRAVLGSSDTATLTPVTPVAPPVAPPVAVEYPCDECKAESVYACACRRCEREGPDKSERFFACTVHRPEVAGKHVRIRGREPRWTALPVAHGPCRLG